MIAREPPSFSSFDEIPDPVAAAPVELPEPPVLASASPTRSARRVRALVALTLAAGWLLALVASRGLRADLPDPHALAPALVWSVAAVAGLAFVLGPRRRGLPASVASLALAFGAVLVALFAPVLATTTLGAPDQKTGACLLFAALLGAGPFALGAAALARSFPSAPAFRGASVGALLGLGAAAAIHLHCPALGGSHVLIAHGAPVVAGVALGGVLGAWRGRIA